MRLLTLALVLSSTVASLAQNATKQKRDVGNFNSLRVSSGLEVFVKQSPNQGITVVGPSDKIDKLKSDLKGNTLSLYIDYDNGWSWGKKASTETLRVYVSLENLEELNVSGGADVVSDDDLLLNTIRMNVSGGADVKLTLNAQKIECNVSGGADVNLVGTSKVLRANVSGGADFHGKNLKVGTAQVNCSGGADSSVWAMDYLMANASGGADIYYYGTPRKLEKNESSSASVSAR
jgi:hypothetical protein